MGPIILMVLMAIVLYFALTYLRGPRNAGNDSDDITTRPFGGGPAEAETGVMPPEPEVEEVTAGAEGDQAEIVGDSVDTLDDSAEAMESEPDLPQDQPGAAEKPIEAVEDAPDLPEEASETGDTEAPL